jgi:hypothetical protein
MEASISLPGRGDVEGFWPGFWLMGSKSQFQREEADRDVLGARLGSYIILIETRCALQIYVPLNFTQYPTMSNERADSIFRPWPTWIYIYYGRLVAVQLS